MQFESLDNFSQNDHNLKNQLQITSPKYHSILPDLATGWRPRNMKISAPILIAYEDDLSQLALDSAIANNNSLVYVGPRYDNSYKFPHLANHYCNSKYSIKYEQMPQKLKKQLEHLSQKNTNRKTLFLGMNPILNQQLIFQSNFQCGNLDFVVKVSHNQYNLFLRPDTNTRGHTQWFYFKVCNSSYPNQSIKLNVLNNRKKQALYRRGMKPYVYSKHLQNTQGIKWQQVGQNITYINLQQKQDILTHFPRFQQLSSEVLSKYYCLSFTYTFQSPKDQVFFAYCPPFTYSQMKAHLQYLKKKSNTQIGISVIEQPLCTSLSGLQIPLLTITDDSIPQQYKKCVIITCRFHPGQSNSSYTLKGFLNYLISPLAEFLRKKIIFKIIPMINPDGVVFGNYRTSLSGKDLNRKFKQKNIQLFPQITHLKAFINKFKRQSGIKLIYYLDFHGHSIKKNSFMYGPQYDLWTSKYEKSKILPKLISKKTDMFRFQSCTFHLSATKKTTARAFMLGFIPFCYTVECSVGLYRSFYTKQNLYFQTSKWEEIGKIIAECLKQSISRIQKQTINPKKRKKKNPKMIQLQTNKQNIQTKLQKALSADQKIHKSPQMSTILTKNISSKKQKIKELPQQKKNMLDKLKYRQHSLQKPQPKRSQSSHHYKRKSTSNKSLSQINKTPSTLIQYDYPQINEQQGQSDGYSQGKSDCQSDDNDFSKQHYKKIYTKILKYIQTFNEAMIGIDNYKNSTQLLSKKKQKQRQKLKTKKNKILYKHVNQQMKMVPSLKYKILQKQSKQLKSHQSKQSLFSLFGKKQHTFAI